MNFFEVDPNQDIERRLGEFLMALGGQAVGVKAETTALPAGNSYWNVAAMIARVGGRMQLGWRINYRSKTLVWAEHYAVWTYPNRAMKDLTAKEFASDDTNPISFIPNRSIRINLKKIPNVRSKYLVLENAPRVAAYVNAYEEQHRSAVALGNLQYRLGYRFEAQFALAEGRGYEGFRARGKDADVLQVRIDEYEQAAQRFREAHAALMQASLH